MQKSLAAVAVAVLALALPAQAHGVFEASELEVHVLNDEGSDAIEPYGGFDIDELFVGFAHDPAVGAGPAGDGFYFRAEVYGLMENGPPAPGQEWTLTFTARTPQGTLTHTLATKDGRTFTGDFDSVLVEVDPAERATHIERAFVSFANAGISPGDEIGPFKVESRVSGDLRDVAPGGIPVPGTNGAATYPDPTAIAGRGELVKSLKALAPEQYVDVDVALRGDGGFNVTVRSALKGGAQHVFVQARQTEGWTYRLDGTTTAPLDANGTLAFVVQATSNNATAPLVLDVLTDVGGRSELALGPDLVLRGPEGVHAGPPLAPAKKSPAASALVAGAVLTLAAALRRRDAA